MPHQSEYQQLWNLIEPIRFGMLSTHKNGSIHSRPMALTQKEFSGKLYFFTKDDSLKVKEVKKDHQVGISFSSPDDHTYVSVSGEARMTKNRGLIEKFWTPMVSAYFPKGKDDEHLALIEVDVEYAEYWDSDKNKMSRLFEIGKAIIKNQTPDLGERAAIH